MRLSEIKEILTEEEYSWSNYDQSADSVHDYLKGKGFSHNFRRGENVYKSPNLVGWIVANDEKKSIAYHGTKGRVRITDFNHLKQIVG